MLTGRYDLVILSASGIELGQIATFHSSECSGVAGTPIALPVNQPKLRANMKTTVVQDQYIVLRVTPGANVTEATSTTGVSTVKIPIRVMDLATKSTRRNVLTVLGTGVTPAGTPSDFTFTILRPQLSTQVWVAGITYPLYQWRVPAGIAVQFGHVPLHAGDYSASAVVIQEDLQTS
jgi:hypothetical protein